MSTTIPSRTECLKLMDQFEMLDNIKSHSLKVARAAETIITSLIEVIPSSQLPEKQLVIAGALLHDIAKTPCLKDGCQHSELGAEICKELGYENLAEIVKEHVILSDYSSTQCHSGYFRAKEIVYYADKRVKHDQVVTLEDRLMYIISRYSKGDAHIETHIKKNFETALDLEKALFSYIPFSSDDLNSNLLNI